MNERFNHLHASQAEKLQFINFLTHYDGAVNREELTHRFGISKATATNLIAAYNQIMPNNLRYNIRQKRYETSNEFKPDPSIQLLIDRMPIYTMPKLHSSVENEGVEKIALISRAIQRNLTLLITYNSVSSGTNKRQIIPVAFADNLLRWHLRAYDRKRQKFIDFVLTRIQKVSLIRDDVIQPHEHPNNDQQWHLFIDLIIKPHPHNLADFHSFDLGMECYRIRIRAAMASYFLKLWGVDCTKSASLRGKEYQYRLANLKEVSEVVNLELAPGYNSET